jgi:hypothetical protein
MKNRGRSKKYYLCVHIREIIIERGTEKTVQNSEIFTLERDIASKNCSVDLRVFIIRECSLYRLIH